MGSLLISLCLLNAHVERILVNQFTLFCWQPAAVLFSHTKSAPANRHHPTSGTFSHSKSTPATASRTSNVDVQLTN